MYTSIRGVRLSRVSCATLLLSLMLNYRISLFVNCCSCRITHKFFDLSLWSFCALIFVFLLQDSLHSITAEPHCTDRFFPHTFQLTEQVHSRGNVFYLHSGGTSFDSRLRHHYPHKGLSSLFSVPCGQFRGNAFRIGHDSFLLHYLQLTNH